VSFRVPARIAVVVGALAVVTIPLDVLIAQSLQSVRLLESLYVVVPVTGVLSLVSLLAARRARLAYARSVLQEPGRVVRAARLFAWAGAWVGLTGAVALAVYGVLRWAQ
jgi:hypothetical protein